MSNADYLPGPLPLLTRLAAALRSIAPVRKLLVGFATLLRGIKKADGAIATEFLGETPEIVNESPGVVDEAAELADTASEITDEIAGVADEIPEVADSIPDVSEVAEVAGRSGIADGAPEIDEVSEVAGISENPDVPAIVDEIPAVTEASVSPLVTPAFTDEVTLAPACSLSAREQLIRRRWAETGIKMWAGQGALNIQGSAELLPLQPGAKRRDYDRLEFRLIAGDIVCEGVIVDPFPSRSEIGPRRP